jgi:NADPH:quinone reductase-like Zn-dependent oxidoreductase
MKAYLFHRPGPPTALRLHEVPHPGAPLPGELLLRVRAIGLNYAEVLSRKGQYSWAPKRPYIPGMEVVGEVVEIGSGVDPKRLGKLVIAGMQYGGYAEYVRVQDFIAFDALPNFSLQENAALLVNFMTAWVALFRQARVQAGECVLVQAAAGGVGSAAIKLLKAQGCHTIGLAGGSRKVALVQELGADLALDYGQPDWEGQVRKAGRLPDAVLELVGGDVFRKSYDLVRPFGRICVAGYASIPLKMWNPLTWWPAWRDAPKAGVMPMAKRSIGLHATHIGYLIQDPPLVQSCFHEMAAFVQQHQLRPLLGQEFPFSGMAEAHQAMEQRGTTGKVVLLLD